MYRFNTASLTGERYLLEVGDDGKIQLFHEMGNARPLSVITGLPIDLMWQVERTIYDAPDRDAALAGVLAILNKHTTFQWVPWEGHKDDVEEEGEIVG